MINSKDSKKLEPGIPCNHPGCCSHIDHPCEGCGRIACGLPIDPVEYAARRKEGRRRWKEEHPDDVPFSYWESKLCLSCGRLVNASSEICYYCSHSFGEGEDEKLTEGMKTFVVQFRCSEFREPLVYRRVKIEATHFTCDESDKYVRFWRGDGVWPMAVVPSEIVQTIIEEGSLAND